MSEQSLDCRLVIISTAPGATACLFYLYLQQCTSVISARELPTPGFKVVSIYGPFGCKPTNQRTSLSDPPRTLPPSSAVQPTLPKSEKTSLQENGSLIGTSCRITRALYTVYGELSNVLKLSFQLPDFYIFPDAAHRAVARVQQVGQSPQAHKLGGAAIRPYYLLLYAATARYPLFLRARGQYFSNPFNILIISKKYSCCAKMKNRLSIFALYKNISSDLLYKYWRY